MKCVVNKNPISKTDIINGDIIPYTGQKDIINKTTHNSPNPVDIGIKCGQ